MDPTTYDQVGAFALLGILPLKLIPNQGCGIFWKMNKLIPNQGGGCKKTKLPNRLD